MINSNCITDTDQIHICRDRQDYKITFDQLQYDVTDFGHLLKLPLEDGPMPWDDILPGRIRVHLTNINGTVTLHEDKAPYCRVWDMDGNRQLKREFDEGSEVVINGPAEGMFKNSLGNWDFGELTETSRCVDFNYMFLNCREFNSNLSVFDMRLCFETVAMFQHCEKFDQDLSGWCVPFNPGGSMAYKMFENTPMENKTDQHPVWGTCPGGKNS